MRLTLTAITKGDSEYKLFKRMLESFMPYMDNLCVGITGFGKKGKIKQLVEQYGGEWVVTTPKTHPKIYLEDENGPFFANFAEARNVTFAMAKKHNSDFIAWADSDDVLINGAEIKSIAKQVKDMKGDRAVFTYWYGVRQNPDGTIKDVIVEHLKERLFNPKIDWKWISRLHEVVVPPDGIEPNTVQVTYNPKPGGTKTVWCHMPPEGHFEPNLYRNIRILKQQLKEEDEQDPRTLFYIAKCYVNLGQAGDEDKYKQAIDYLERYLDKSGWAEERANACQYLGLVYTQKKDFNEALEWYHRAVREHPISPMSYLWLAHLYEQKGMTEQSSHWLNVAMNLPAPDARSTIGEPLAIRNMAATLKYNEALRNGNLKGAIEWRKRWNKIDGRDDETDELLEILESSLEANNAAEWYHNYAIYLKNNNHQDELIKLMDVAPPEFKQEAFYQKLRNEVMPPKKWPKKSIVYMAAAGFAPWNPKTALEDGLGGSETAIVMLSTVWAKKGYEVTVYANVTEEAKVKGVDYKHWSGINIKDQFDILIIWRNPPALEQPWKANKIYMDMHDICSQPQFSVESMAKVDKVFFKSEFQRKMLPDLPDSKAIIISNGINV